MIFAQYGYGILIGIIIGFSSYLYTYITGKEKNVNYMKAGHCICIVFILQISLSSFLYLDKSYAIACISFGYVSRMLWGKDNLPMIELKQLSIISTPFLFGTVGATIVFN